MKKVCKDCGQAKSVDEFYKHKMMADGRLNRCKECVRSRVRKHRDENIERIRAYDRERGGLKSRVEARRLYAKTPDGIESLFKAREKYKKKNPLKNAAHCMVNNAVRDGRLTKKPCEVCGATKKIHGHHEDYYKPLEVVWLCHKHHMELHKKNRG